MDINISNAPLYILIGILLKNLFHLIEMHDVCWVSQRFPQYFRDCIVADIDSLAFYGGIHEITYGYHRKLASRFPFVIYYKVGDEVVTVVAVLDARRDPSWTRNRLS